MTSVNQATQQAQYNIENEDLKKTLGGFAVGILGTTFSIVSAVALGVFIGSAATLTAPGIVFTVALSLGTAVAGSTLAILTAIWLGCRQNKPKCKPLDQNSIRA